MIRILHVLNRMGYGGIETFIMNIYRNIDRNKIQFDFAVHTTNKGEYDEEIKKMGGNIYYFTSRRNNVLKYKKDWEDFLNKNAHKYNAIHMHVSSVTTILPLVLAKKYNIKNRLIHAHSTSQQGKIHEILSYINKKRINKFATKLLACSTEAGEYVFGKNKFELFHNGINSKIYKLNDEIRNDVRKKLNLKDNEIAYVHVGRFCYAKNHQFLIKIFNEINKKNSNSKLFLIGTGELKENVVEQVKQLNLTEEVIFLGTRNDIPNLLQGMDLFIFPSNYEGLPVAMIEAQAAGLPIFASTNISKESKISDLVTFISLEKNEKEWASLIMNNKIKREKNTETILKNAGYEIKETVKKIEKIYLN